MQKTAGIMYTVGKVLNIIGIVFASLFSVLLVVAIAQKDQVYQELINQGYTDFASPEELAAMLSGILIAIIIGLVLTILLLIFGNKAKKALGNGETAPHVIVLVFAVLSGEIFYLIGSILGIVLSSSKSNNQPQQEPPATQE